MPVANLPPSLNAIFNDLQNRLQRLENSVRFSAPVTPPLTTQPTVTGLTSGDPTNPRSGDLWLNASTNNLKVVDKNGLVTYLGYLGMPQNSQNNNYTFTQSDSGKHIYMTATGKTLTIPANSSVPLAIGTTFVVVNAAAVSTTVAITTDTMIQANTTNTGSRTLAASGMATILKIAATTWIISGNGVS